LEAEKMAGIVDILNRAGEGFCGFAWAMLLQSGALIVLLYLIDLVVRGPAAGFVGKAGFGILVAIYCRKYAVYIFGAATVMSLWAAWYNVCSMY
jgi:hypothetical protein